MKRIEFAGLLLSILLSSAMQLHAQVTFSFEYADPAGTGFNTSEHKGALELAANNFGETVLSAYQANWITSSQRGVLEGDNLQHFRQGAKS